MANRSIVELRRQAEEALNKGAFEAAHGCCIEILRREPEFADAWFLLGMIALAHGRAAKALELIDRALSGNPDRAEYLAHRARCLVLMHRDPEALADARRALSLGPGDALTLDTIGVVLTKAGDHAAAVTAFERAVAIRPDQPDFHFNLGSARQFVGQIAAAGQSYEAAIRLRPEFYRAHWALSELEAPAPGSGRIDRLEGLLASHGDDADCVLYLCHALAREYERRGDYDRAFAHWERGKQGGRAVGQGDAGEIRALFEEVAAVCTRQFVRQDGGYESNAPIFVVGMPRTGTTLVEQMLGSLGDVDAAGELDTFGVLLKRAARTASNRILDAETIRAAREIDFSALGEAYIELTKPLRGERPRFVDKLPTNFLYAGFIHRALPGAKIVCLRRHPLDTCLSNFRQLFSVSAPYYSYATDLLETGRYYVLFHRLIEHWRTVLPADCFLELWYEEIVSNPEAETRRLAEFCELRWDPGMLESHTGGRPAATASAAQVRQPIYTTSIGRWRNYEGRIEPLRALLTGAGIDVP